MVLHFGSNSAASHRWSRRLFYDMSQVAHPVDATTASTITSDSPLLARLRQPVLRTHWYKAPSKNTLWSPRTQGVWPFGYVIFFLDILFR
jgi:hypothetical protein